MYIYLQYIYGSKAVNTLKFVQAYKNIATLLYLYISTYIFAYKYIHM